MTLTLYDSVFKNYLINHFSVRMTSVPENSSHDVTTIRSVTLFCTSYLTSGFYKREWGKSVFLSKSETKSLRITKFGMRIGVYYKMSSHISHSS